MKVNKLLFVSLHEKNNYSVVYFRTLFETFSICVKFKTFRHYKKSFNEMIKKAPN